MTPTTLYALVRDLMFVSRITSTARVQGVAVKVVRDPQQLAGEAAPGAARLIVDLNLPGAIPAAAAWKAATSGEVVGFVSHVDAQTIQSAREAGLDRVMPRSQFVQVLPELLRPENPQK
jgi:hypothetical protein